MKNHNRKKVVYLICVLLPALIFSQTAFALPPDPDNAALLYYQAFCTYEKPDDTMKNMIRELAKGEIEPNPTITKYIENCRPAIKLAADASELTNCDWGAKYSDGLDLQIPQLSQTRLLTHIILADARIALKQSNYDLAIERCLTARKLGIDVGQAPIAMSFLVEKSVVRITNKCIQDILSSYLMETETLQQLKIQLDKLDSRSKPLEFFLEIEHEVMGMYITPEKIQELLPWLAPEKEDYFVNAPDNARKLIRDADEQFCQKNLAYYNKYWSEIFSALELPYQQTYNKLIELAKKLSDDCQVNSDTTMTTLLAPTTAKIYNLGIKIKTFSNAVKTAIKIYKIAAQTGQLPNSLPAGLPKDLLSGKDFEYEKTADGFTLRCQGKDLSKDETYEYEFKVKK